MKTCAAWGTWLCLALVAGLLLVGDTQAAGPQPPSARRGGAVQAIGQPVLKWSHGGCYASWCETGWYSSPAVGDLDQDGAAEVIGAAYTVFALNGKTGAVKWSAPPPASGARAWPGVVVADLDGNGEVEVVTAHGSGYVRVLDRAGKVVWTRQPTPGYELRSLAAADLDGNGDVEILVSSTRNNDQWYVFEHDGSVRTGWPQLASSGPGYAAGCYNENLAVADLDQDGRGEIVGPSDVHYITAYEDNGAQTPANARYGNKFWSQVGVHVSDAVDLRGWANCANPPQPPLEARPNFADSAPTLADINADGKPEVIVVGNNYDCRTVPYTDLYQMPYIFNRDRSRWNDSGFDWTAIPTPDAQAAPLSEDYEIIETAQPNPVVADLDGDGYREILYAAYDGRVHAYWLDKIEHGHWPFDVYTGGLYRFASEPAVADLDNDGKAEVIFASWPLKGSHATGKLFIVDYLGNLLQAVDLPPAFGSPDWNGALAAPTLADIDGDGELEAILNTAHSGLVAYDLPGTSHARILWGTGRGNYQRTGSYLAGSVESANKSVTPLAATPGGVLTYSITLRNSGPALRGVRVTDTLPTELTYLGKLWASSGSYAYTTGVITWTGSLPAGGVSIVFGVKASTLITEARSILNTALVTDGRGTTWTPQAVAIISANSVYLPVIRKH